ncbi:MAG: hypothetical protein ACXW61_04750 [Gemmatirosa sp.]
MNAGAMVAIMAANTAASAAAAAERRQLDGFRLADATGPARARKPESIGLPRDGAFASLVQQGVLREVGDGRVWLDEAALIAQRDAKPARSARIVLIVLLVAAVLVALGVLLLARGTMSAGAT